VIQQYCLEKMALPDLFARLFKRPVKTELKGSQRPLSEVNVSIARNYDLEIRETPIRNPFVARALIEMRQYCYEVRHGLLIASRDTFASSDGDDQGWAIAPTLDDNETKTNPDTLAIANDLKDRRIGGAFVIGGDRLSKALHLSLIYGDCFLELGIEREGIGKKDYGIARTLYLPTWEMFRCETDTGILEGFEQKRYIGSSDPDHFFYPPEIIHFKHEFDGVLYGMSLYWQSLQYWEKLKEATQNLATAAREIGINPNVHQLPEFYTPDQARIYKQKWDQDKKGGQITDIFLANGIQLKKLSSQNPDLQSLVDTLLQWRYYTIPPTFPTYLFPGLQSVWGTKELSRQPAMAYARTRYGFCQLLTKGIRQAIDTEIILKKGLDWFQENGKYRIIWPEWTIDGMEPEADSNITGMDDLDLADNGNKQRVIPLKRYGRF
jgi:hypothetical protein